MKLYRQSEVMGRESGPSVMLKSELVKQLKPFAEKFYKGKAWQECRDAYYAYRYGLCERCGKPGLIVHHREKLTPLNINDPNVTLNWEKLELLCLDCHNREHGESSPTQDGLSFDEEGNLIPVSGWVAPQGQAGRCGMGLNCF